MKWIEPPEIQVSPELSSVIGGNPLVSKILTRRGITDPKSALAFIDPLQYQPSPPGEIPGLMNAADVLERAFRDDKKICVWGDFDVDGQTSTALLVSTLRELGYHVTFYIPNRERESHGINQSSLSEALMSGFDVLLTCDTGITAHDAIDYARRNGVEVVITDHHDLPESLPDANAITNPKMLPASHPLATLPGVGVAYKLAEELYSRLKPDTAPDYLLDLVALGIVADVSELRGDVRYLLQRGISALRYTERLGMIEMMKFNNLSPRSLTEEQIGFSLAPRLNALGRLSDTNIIVDFLTTSDLILAQKVTLELEKLNNQRKLLTDQVLQGALSQIERDPSLVKYAALVLVHPSWHGGVLGPVASRLVEIYHKPCILLRSPPGEDARGSARSVNGCDISTALRTNQHFLHNFGGHPMAAGLSLSPDDIPAFRVALSHTIHEMTGMDEIEPSLDLDAYVDLSELNFSLLQDIERLAPFGPGNAQPLFCSRKLQLSSQKAIGQDKEHLILTLEDDLGNQFKVMHWRGAGLEFPQGAFDLAYYARTSNYQGVPGISLQWVDARQVDGTALELGRTQLIDVIDHRQEPHPVAVLNALPDFNTVQIWGEGENAKKLGGKDRTRLEPASELVIWTTPPSRLDLEITLQRVAPKILHLFCVDPPPLNNQSFLRLLLGMVKHVVSNKYGKIRIEALAAAIAYRTNTVLLGLKCLEDQGLIKIEYLEDGMIFLEKGDGLRKEDEQQLTVQLQAQLDETSSFRHFFRSAALESLHRCFKSSSIGPTG